MIEALLKEIVEIARECGAHLMVDEVYRKNICKNHSATHLLQKALRTVLGSHVEQAGSFVNEDRLRFDFTHFSAVTPEELKKVEEIVNEQIQNALEVVTKNLPIEEARKTGAQALFGEKYGDVVRVVDMGGFSVEFCGGTHVKNTSEIMALKIISESGVAAGVRRIEALTSDGLMKYYAEMEHLLKEAAQLIKASPENLAEKITHLQAENKALKGEVDSLKSKMAQEAAGNVLDRVYLQSVCNLYQSVGQQFGYCYFTAADLRCGRINHPYIIARGRPVTECRLGDAETGGTLCLRCVQNRFAGHACKQFTTFIGQYGCKQIGQIVAGSAFGHFYDLGPVGLPGDGIEAYPYAVRRLCRIGYFLRYIYFYP